MPKSNKPRTQGRLGGRFTRSRETLDEDGNKIHVKHGGRNKGAFGSSSKKSIGNNWLK